MTYESHKQLSAETKRATHRRYNLYSQYGLRPADYGRMFEEQNGACAICKSPGSLSNEYALCVDHCHKTGLVRGLLCNKCNVGLGQFNDDPDLMFEAIEYLERQRPRLFFHKDFRAKKITLWGYVRRLKNSSKAPS